MNNRKIITKGLGIILCLLMVFSSCKKDISQNNKVHSFLPMQVGNYWGTANRQNSYTQIQETVEINRKTFYKFYSVIGGDAISIAYLRID